MGAENKVKQFLVNPKSEQSPGVLQTLKKYNPRWPTYRW